MTNQKDSSVKTAKPAENPAKEDQNETPTEEKATDASITVVVHPLVLLSVVDHFNRMGKIGNQKRVVGVLLGSWASKSHLDVSNSFAVPFDEDEKDSTVWYLDHQYLEQMYSMFKKVNAKERIVGWYHTGPKLHPNDIKINDLLRNYCSNSVLVIIGAKPRIGLPTEAYKAVEEVHDDGTPTTKTFEHVPSEIGAEEAEEVGVEHLLRDIKDTTVGTLSQKITNQLMGLKGLEMKLKDMHNYLQQVVDEKLPMNHQITYLLQDIFNLLPDVTNPQFVKSINVNTNDQMLVLYTSSLIRSIIALHNLINNKINNKEAEKREGKKDEKDKDKDKASKDEKDKDKDKDEKNKSKK